MKYHTLKMEEVNDIMRHLWNKTYQGTDIDGIMIRSEGDGGGTRKSYNYRVRIPSWNQLPKKKAPDQPFVSVIGGHDERSSRDGYARAMQRWPKNAGVHHNPPCSLGFVRSRLWHFRWVRAPGSQGSQLNPCHTALDEPTNALDVENIEALAASLVE